MLTIEAAARFHETGYAAPIRVLSAAEAASHRARLEAFIRDHGGSAAAMGLLRTKAHLNCASLAELTRHPRILDAVEDVLGPDILCWASGVFLKEPRDPAYVSWHQDAMYWGLDPADVVTAWVALTDSTVENGAMQVLPGTHRGALFPHADTYARANLLSRGQEIAVDIDPARRDLAPASRRDVAASCQAGARLGRQRLRRPAHRLRHPLRGTACPPDRRRQRQRDFGTRHRPLRNFAADTP